MVTIHSPGFLPRASSAIRSWMSRIERTRPSEGKTLRSASRSICAWPSVMPGMTVRPPRSMTRVVGPACAATAASGPTATMRSPAMAMAWAIVKSSTVTTLPFRRMISADAVAPASRRRRALPRGRCRKAACETVAVRWRRPFRKDRRGMVSPPQRLVSNGQERSNTTDRRAQSPKIVGLEARAADQRAVDVQRRP